MICSTIQTQSGLIGVIHIGLGLIGAAIDRTLAPDIIDRKVYKLQWSSEAKLIATINKALDHLDGDIRSYEIIWSAGRAGFSASQEEVAAELVSFRQINKLLYGRLGCEFTRFWLMSSAGGLHEGQICVNSSDQATPKRPYAELKLQQEQLVQTLWSAHVICRVSSVYTVANLSGRMGLVAVLMLNAVQHRVTTLVGGESTLRDYVLDKDIGRSVARAIRNRAVKEGIQYFVSGRPLSIKTIKNEIENITLKKLYVKFSKIQSNATSITFLPQMRSEMFYTTPFNANVKQLYHNITRQHI